MKSSKTIINIVLGLLLLTLLYLGYRAFLTKEGPVTNTPRVSPTGFSVEGGNPEIRQRFVDTLRRVENIQFRTEVFENPIFRSLIDFQVILFDKPVGRENPFAPLGVGNIFNPPLPLPPPPTN